jgi:hypothetical protein
VYLFSILSVRHFSAYQQVIDDYKSLLIYENELMYMNNKKTSNYERVKNEVVVLLERIIKNKNFLNENTKADQEYLLKIKNDNL